MDKKKTLLEEKMAEMVSYVLNEEDDPNDIMGGSDPMNSEPKSGIGSTEEPEGEEGESLIDRAEKAFWNVVKEESPDVTNELSPEASTELKTAMQKAIDEWKNGKAVEGESEEAE